MSKPLPPGRPNIYPKGSRVPFNARIDKRKKETIERNLSRFGVTTFTEWIDLQMDQSIQFLNSIKKKD